MLDRIKNISGIGNQLIAERMLEQQENIPKDWIRFYLLFPRTIHDDGKYSYGLIPGLQFSHQNYHWEMFWKWIGNSFEKNDRIVHITD